MNVKDGTCSTQIIMIVWALQTFILVSVPWSWRWHRLHSEGGSWPSWRYHSDMLQLAGCIPTAKQEQIVLLFHSWMTQNIQHLKHWKKYCFNSTILQPQNVKLNAENESVIVRTLVCWSRLAPFLAKISATATLSSWAARWRAVRPLCMRDTQNSYYIHKLRPHSVLSFLPNKLM